MKIMIKLLIAAIAVMTVCGFTSIHHRQDGLYRPAADYSSVPFTREKAALSDKGIARTYFGYLPYWIDTSAYDNFRYELLTDIAYFSIEMGTDGSLGSLPNASRYNRIYSDCRKHGVDIHMTITLFSSSSVASFLNSSAARNNGVSNISSLIGIYDLDGINIDFEFITESVRDSFTLFIDSLEDYLHYHSEGRKELSIAMPAVVSWYPGYDYYNLGLLADGLFIMAYDYHYSGSGNAGPVAPTMNSSFWGYYAVNTTVGDYINAGVDRDKIILGIPYYGYDWPTVDETKNAQTTGSGSAVIYRYAKSNAQTYNRDWDSDSYTPFYDFYSTEWHQCWYDDSLSIGRKLSIASDSMLQGAGCWALGYDDGESDVWNEIENAFWYEPPEDHFIVKINTPGLNVRKGPGSEYDILSVVHENELYPVFLADGNWYKIYYPSGSGPSYGWIYGGNGYSSIYAEGLSDDSLIRITASLLNVRSGPTTDSTVITQASRGQCFAVDSLSGNWARLFLADSNIYGWAYYTAYSRTVTFPEDSNELNLHIDSLVSPDTVHTSDGSFTLTMYMTNNSYSIPDSGVDLTGYNNSPFYESTTWSDSSAVSTGGYNGIVNQRFTRTAFMGIPSITDTSLVCDTFFLSKSGLTTSNDIVISVIVANDNSSINREEETHYSDSNEQRTSVVYDILGRKLLEKNIKGNPLPALNLKAGVYFIQLNNDFTKRVIIR